MRIYDIPMENGTVKGTLNIGAQADLSAKRHDLWEEWNEIYTGLQNGNGMTEITMGKALYIAYACANINDDIMTENEFLHNLSDDRNALAKATEAMFGTSEKKTGSPQPSNRPRKRNRKR